MHELHMKKIILIIILVAAGVFLSGYRTFSHDRVVAYLDRMEDEVNSGNTVAACGRLSESMTFDLQDNSANNAVAISGGKTDLCQYFQKTAQMYKTAPIADRHYKADMSVKRNLFNWNLATVSYTEHHEIEYFPSRVKIKTRSKEQMVIQKKGDDLIVSKWVIDIALDP